MLALRLASNSIKNRVLSFQCFPLCNMRSEIAISYFDEWKMTSRPTCAVIDICLPFSELYHSQFTISCYPVWKNTFCSQASTKNHEEEVLDEENLSSNLVLDIFATPHNFLGTILDMWAKGGKYLKSDEIVLINKALRRERMFAKALKVWEWAENNKHGPDNEAAYADRLDLVAKLRGIASAEKHMESIPISFRGEMVYRTLLSNVVFADDSQKAEEIFKKMRALKLPISHFAYNQMLILYARINRRRKIIYILDLMKNNRLKPILSTYKILMDAHGRHGYVTGMERLLKEMKAEKIEFDHELRSILVKYYVRRGHRKKAKAVLNEFRELSDRKLVPFLLPLYASLGSKDAVSKLCGLCEPNPTQSELLASVSAWGKLHDLEMAEAVVSKARRCNRANRVLYHKLLRVYADHKEVARGKHVLKEMKGSGHRIGSYCWGILTRLLLAEGEERKAEMALRKAYEIQKGNAKAPWGLHVEVMEFYAGKGDVFNCERVFREWKDDGNTARFVHFKTLIDAYRSARKPAYGVMERMRGEEVGIPRYLLPLLERIDSFEMTSTKAMELDLLR